jgi:hypothetical protein
MPTNVHEVPWVATKVVRIAAPVLHRVGPCQRRTLPPARTRPQPASELGPLAAHSSAGVLAAPAIASFMRCCTACDRNGEIGTADRGCAWSPNRWPDNSRQDGESGRPAPCPAALQLDIGRMQPSRGHCSLGERRSSGLLLAVSGRLRHQRYGNEQQLRTLRSSERSRSAFARSTDCRRCAASRPGRFMQVQVPTLERRRCR